MNTILRQALAAIVVFSGLAILASSALHGEAEAPVQRGLADIGTTTPATDDTPGAPASAPSNTLTFAPAPDEPAPDTAKPGAQKNDVVELPRYVVTGERILPPPESWRHATLPGYEILSNASDRATKNFLKDFQQLQMSIRVIWPTLISQKSSLPTLILICARGDSFRPFVPETHDPDIFITPTSLFVEDKERGAIVIDFGMHEVLNSSGFFSTNDPYQQFYRQYARFLMRRANNNKPLPPWLEEGLSRLFSTLDFSKKYIEFGKIDDGFGGGGNSLSDYFAPEETNLFDDMTDPDDPLAPDAGGNRNFTGSNRTGGGGGRGFSKFGYIAPLSQIFNPDPAKPPGNWSKQCYAFVHMCIYGYQKKYQKAFLSFAQRAMAHPVEESDFVECFGRTYKQMALTLRGYVESPNHESLLYKAKRGSGGLPDPVPVELREATQAEIGRIKGETLRLAGHPDASREALIVPYLRHERDAGLLASLGLLESLEGRAERARKFLETAAKDNVVRPRAYAALARLRLEEALANPEAPDNKLSARQTVSVLEPLFVARTQQPPMEEVYSLIGDTWLGSSVVPKATNLDIMLEGTTLFPRSPGLVYRAAALYAKNGSPEIAGILVRLGLRISLDEATRQNFEELQASLPAPSALPPTNTPAQP